MYNCIIELKAAKRSFWLSFKKNGWIGNYFLLLLIFKPSETVKGGIHNERKKLSNVYVLDGTIDESENLATNVRRSDKVEEDKDVDKKESSIILKLIISFFTGGGFSTLISKILGGEEITEIFQFFDSISGTVVVFLICLTIIACILINRVFDLKEIEITNKESQREKMLQESIQTIKKNNEELKHKNAELKKQLLKSKKKC